MLLSDLYSISSYYMKQTKYVNIKNRMISINNAKQNLFCLHYSMFLFTRIRIQKNETGLNNCFEHAL